MALRVYEGSRIMLDIYNVLDAISEIVYVSDAETHEILYIRRERKFSAIVWVKRVINFFTAKVRNVRIVLA